MCAARARIHGPLPATKPSRIAVQVHRRPNGVLSRAGGDPTQHSHFIYAICSAKMVTGAPFVGPKPSGPFVAGFVSALAIGVCRWSRKPMFDG